MEKPCIRCNLQRTISCSCGCGCCCICCVVVPGTAWLRSLLAAKLPSGFTVYTRRESHGFWHSYETTVWVGGSLSVSAGSVHREEAERKALLLAINSLERMVIAPSYAVLKAQEDARPDSSETPYPFAACLSPDF